MKKFSTFFFFLLFGGLIFSQDASDFLPVRAAGSGWVAIGPSGGDIRGMAFNPGNKNEIFVVAYSSPSQVFRSTDGGQFWSRIAVISGSIFAMTIDPTNVNNVYVLGSSELYKSTDRGVNWKSCRFGNYCYSWDGKIGVSLSNPSIIYASGYYYYDTYNWKSRMAVFKSTDGGESWTVKQLNYASSDNGYALSLAVDPTNPNIVYAGGYYYIGSTSYYKLYKSTDGGNSWEDKTGPINGSPEDIVLDPTNPSKAYVGTTWGVFRSADGGQSWSKNSGYAFAYAIGIDASNPNTLYAGYQKKCYKSPDGGVNWTEYTGGLSGNCSSLLVSWNRVFYGSSAGVYRSDDGGIVWQAIHRDIKATQIPALALAPSAPNVIYAEVATDGFFKSTDFGANWTRLPDFYRCDSIYRIEVNPNNSNDVFFLAGG